ncbi:MAG: hypothetical protein R3281_07355 [Balneolaceae bacterium]|nr:hypothetical protein [Balneolaceae bacterium]
MIRKAREEDLSAIDYIYNQAIYAGFCTAHLHPLSEQERKEWYQRHAPNDRPFYIY